WDHLGTLAGQRPQGKLAELLGSELEGFSRLVAREVVFRAHETIETQAGDADWTVVRQTVTDLLAPLRGEGTWSPSLARYEGNAVAFAPYRLSHLEDVCDVQDVASISAAVEQGFADRVAAASADGTIETASQL